MKIFWKIIKYTGIAVGSIFLPMLASPPTSNGGAKSQKKCPNPFLNYSPAMLSARRTTTARHELHDFRISRQNFAPTTPKFTFASWLPPHHDDSRFLCEQSSGK
jgi:hypothetical protein